VATEAVLYVRDLETLAAFYETALGLTSVEKGTDYCGLGADGLILWLVRGRRARAEDAGGGHPPRRRSEAAVKLAFEVASIEQAAGVIESLGGWIATNTWEFGRRHRRDATDPEGNVIQLLEPLASPEQPSR
jgi:predicted enzyme related to lactoylglutathione lyase